MANSAAGVVASPVSPVRVEIVDGPGDLHDLVAWATTPRTGAVVTFLGTVRDHSPGLTGVVAIDYEVYDAGALVRLLEITDRCRRSFAGVGRVAIVHRRGLVALGEPSVWVVVGAEHRAAAIEAATYCIDVLKETVPIWKRELTADGRGHWVDGTAVAELDDAHEQWFAGRTARSA